MRELGLVAGLPVGAVIAGENQQRVIRDARLLPVFSRRDPARRPLAQRSLHTRPASDLPVYPAFGTHGVCGAVSAKYRKQGSGFAARSRMIETALSVNVGRPHGS